MASETDLVESSSSNKRFILQKLFDLELEEVIQKIFLFLDPESLKNSKSTCIQWREFIDRRIWKSKTGMEELNRKLILQWKSVKPEKCGYMMLPSYVWSLVCDNQRVVAAFVNGIVVGYDSETLAVLYTFDEFQETDLRWRVQLDMNEDHLLIMSGHYVLTILDKTTGTKLYQGVPFKTTGCIHKMIKNTAVVSDYNGNICFIKNENQEEADRWIVNKFYDANLRGVTSMDGNNDYLTIGTERGIYLWDVKTMKLVESSIGKIKVETRWRRSRRSRMLTMIYPFVFVVGKPDFKGLKVFNLETGNCIRDYQNYMGRGFLSVHTNGRFLIISESREYREKCWNVIITLDTQELINEKIQDKDLWIMEQECGSISRHFHAVLNKTKIFVANPEKLTVLDCWRDRVHDVIDDDDNDSRN